jgi:hypothetical protein
MMVQLLINNKSDCNLTLPLVCYSLKSPLLNALEHLQPPNESLCHGGIKNKILPLGHLDPLWSDQVGEVYMQSFTRQSLYFKLNTFIFMPHLLLC